MAERLVLALGGHTLARTGEACSVEAQRRNARRALGEVTRLIRDGHRVAITHGNGPQVGHQMLRAEAARGKAYDLPLDVCVAQSQGEIGYLLQQVLAEELSRGRIDRPVVTIVTEVLVDPSDPSFRTPTKPVGPVLASEQAEELEKLGAAVGNDPGRGLRRLVASPRPLRILQAATIRRLFDDGAVVIAAGGGGIPVLERKDGALEGVEAVVDKDLTAAELAIAIDADRMLNLTSVDAVRLDFLGPSERSLEILSVPEARRYLKEGHFAPGSMGPKIEGAVRFLESARRGEVLITSPENLSLGLEGKAGTRIGWTS